VSKSAEANVNIIAVSSFELRCKNPSLKDDSGALFPTVNKNIRLENSNA
jgi:hypothetical protein